MSNLSPFLQEVTKNLKANGASNEEVGVVTNELENNIELQKEQCNKTEGYVFNTETNTCEQKVDLKKQELVQDPIEIEEPTEEPIAEEVVEEQTAEELIKKRTDEGLIDVSLSVPERLLKEAKDKSKQQYNEDALDFDKEKMFFMREIDFNTKGTEEAFVDMMLRKYGGIGLEIKVSGVGTSKFIIGGKEVALKDAWTELWNPKLDISPKEKAETVNEMVKLLLAEKQDPASEAYDPKFDFDTYMEAYKHSALKTDGNSINFEDASIEDLEYAMGSTYNVLLENYSKTDEGKPIFQEIEVNQSFREVQILNKAAKLYAGDPNGFVKYVQEQNALMMNDLYYSNPKLEKFNYNSGIAIENYFGKSIRKKEIDENLEERYGFLSNWKFGTAFVKGFDVTFKKELAIFRGGVQQQLRAKDGEIADAFFNSLDNIGKFVGDEKVYNLSETKTGRDLMRNVFTDVAYPYSNMIFDENTEFKGVDRNGNPIPVKGTYKKFSENTNYKLVETGKKAKEFDFNKKFDYSGKAKFGGTISSKQIKDFINRKNAWRVGNVLKNILKGKELQDLENTLTREGSNFIDEDGKINITSENYNTALGDTAFRLVVSAVGVAAGGAGGMIMESSGIIEQALGEKTSLIPGFDNMSPEEQAKIMMKILDTNPQIIDDAFVGGGINAALDTFSSAVFFGLGPAAKEGTKLLVNNIDDLFAFIARQEFKQALKVIVAGGKKITKSTLTEVFTEGLQEFNTSRAVKGYDNLNENWDFNRDAKDPVMQAMFTTLLTIPVLGAGTGSVKTFSNSWKNHVLRARSPKNILVTAKAQREQLSKDFKNGYIIDENGEQQVFTQEDYENCLMQISAAEQMFTPLEISLSDEKQVQKLYNASMKQIQETEKMNTIKKKDKELQSTYGKDYKTTLEFENNEAERLIVQGKIDEAVKQKLIAKHTDYYLTKGIELAGKINKDYNDIVQVEVLDAKQSVSYLLNQLPDNIKNSKEVKQQIKNIKNGRANAFIMTIDDFIKIDPNYEGKGLAIGIEDNIKNNIQNSKSDNIVASNAIHHEFEHLLFSLKYPGKEGTAKLENFRNKLDNTLKNSKSPEMRAIYNFITGRMMDYQKQGTDLKSRVGIEEYLAAFGDACRSLGIQYDKLGTDFKTNFDKIGQEFKNLIHGNEKTNNWTLRNTFDFLQGFDSANDQNIQPVVLLSEDGTVSILDYQESSLYNLSERVEDMPENDSFNGNKQSIVQDNDIEVYRMAVNAKYPKRSSMSKQRRLDDASSINKDIATELLNLKKFKFPNKDNKFSAQEIKEIEKKYKEETDKKLRQDLIWNNWGAFEDLIKEWRTNEGLDLIPGNRDQFIGKALEQFVRATQTYKPAEVDSFYAYYFGIGTAKKRLAEIYDGLNKVFTQPIDPTDDTPGMTDTEISNYVDNEIDAATVINDFNERSALRKAMSKVVGFEEGGKFYNDFVDNASKVLGEYDFAEIFNPKASQNIRNMGMGLWKDLRGLSQADLEAKFYKDGKPSKEYIGLITETIDVFYNQMSVRDLKKFLAEDADTFITTIEGRQNVEDYLASKGRDKAKNKYAGNEISTKNELTPELKDILLEKLLQTNKIAQLEAEGLTKAEIADAIRADSMIQRTMKNYSSILMNDVFMQIVTSKKFKAANGVTDSQISQAALLLDKGIDVKFQLNGETKTVYASDYEGFADDPMKFAKETFTLIAIGDQEFTDEERRDEVIGIITAEGQRLKMSQGAIDFAVSLFDKGFVEDAGTSQYQSNIKADPNIPEDVKTERIPIKTNTEGKNTMHDNAVIMSGLFGKKFMETIGYEFLGYKNKSDFLQVGKKGGEFSDRFLNMVDGVKDVELSPEMETALKNFRPYNLKTGESANLTKTTASTTNNVFQRLKAILEQPISREEKLAQIRKSGLAVEIENANKANIFILTDIITKFKDAALNGKIDEKAMLEMFKMGSSLVLGLRSFSTLIGFQAINGEQVVNKGEHLGSYSDTFSKVVSLIYKYKKDKNIDFNGELSIILSEFGQVLGNEKHFVEVDKAKRTNPEGIYRGNLIKTKGYTNANGIDLKNIQAEILLDIENKKLISSEQPQVKYSVESSDPEASRNFVVVDESGNLDLDQSFNSIIENESGIEAFKTYSEAEGKIRGQGNKSIFDIIFPASAYDLEQFTYKYLGKGKIGDKQKQFFEENLFRPFAEATRKINTEKQRISEAQKDLIKKLPKINKSLKNKIKNKKGETTYWTREHALRVWLWDKNGIANAKDLGLAQETHDMLIAEVNADENLQQFATKLGELSAQTDGYIKPSQYWTVEGVTQDLQRITSDAGRAKYLEKWKANVDILFSEENKNKLRAAYGNKHVEALEDMLYRMEFGKNKKQSSRIETAWNNWVNNSVGAVMFLNTRSGILQTISAANYIDYEDNNFIEAGKRVLDIKQYSKDAAMIFFSNYLKQRRGGHTRGVNEAELAAVIEKGGVKGAMSWFLEKGFVFAKWGDSWSISSGGATFYRSKVIAYEKQGMTTEEAEAKAFIDFQERTEANQQSSRADKISQQQAGGLGRILLAFGNTPMQYNRIIMKSVQDLKNNRGKTIENIGRIAYYGAVQNAIFVTLQQAVFAAFGEDEDEWDKKTKRAASGMVDSLLKGMGLSGVVISTAKNSYMQWQDQRKKGYNADHAYTILQFANMSPTIGSKLRKLYAGTQAEKFNQDTIDEMGFDINSPALNAIANLISATTNVPTDRALQKTQNILLASKDHVEVQDKIALLLGWNPWDLNVETEAKIVRKEVKKKKEIKKKEEKVETEQKKVDVVVEEEVKKEEEGKGEDVNTCAASKSDGSGRCGVKVDKAGDKCQYHASEKEKSKMKKCGHIKKNGKQCGNYAVNDAGRCNVKQHQPGYKKK